MTTALLLKIGAESAALRNDLNRANGLVNQFTAKITGAGAAIAGALTVGAVSEFVMEVSRLSAEAEGVRYAFEKLGGSKQLLHDLKEATHGTVSELELMKNAVAFKNFNLDVSQLPKLLEFATLRAQQTGQSVDYLVQSIVTGLGRKSVLILDNLGISAATLNAEVAKTGDFFGAVGKIVDTEIVNMGQHLETTITKTERLSASWVNFKVAAGDAANGTGILGTSMDVLSASLELASSKYLSFWEKVAAFASVGGAVSAKVKMIVAEQKALNEEQRKHAVTVDIATEAVKKYGGNLEEITKAYKDIGGGQAVIAEAMKMINALGEKHATQIENEKNLTEQLNAKKEASLLLMGSARARINDEIAGIEKKIKKLRELSLAEQKQAQVKTLAPVQRNANPLTGEAINYLPAINANIQTLSLAATTQLPAVGAAFMDLSYVVQNAMAGMAMGMGAAIGDMLTGVGGIELLASAVVAGFGAMAVELGQTMIQFGLAGVAMKKLVMSPGLSIAAGVALVALGKALSNKARSITGGGGGAGGGGGSGGTRPQALTKVEYGKRIEVVGEFELRGDTAVALIRNQERRDNRTLPKK